MKKPFEFLADINDESIVTAIINEHPQTIALITSCLQPTQAAYIFESLPPESQVTAMLDALHACDK